MPRMVGFYIHFWLLPLTQTHFYQKCQDFACSKFHGVFGWISVAFPTTWRLRSGNWEQASRQCLKHACTSYMQSLALLGLLMRAETTGNSLQLVSSHVQYCWRASSGQQCDSCWRASSGQQDTCRMGIWVVTGAVADGNVCSFAWASYSSTLLVSLTSV